MVLKSAVECYMARGSDRKELLQQINSIGDAKFAAQINKLVVFEQAHPQEDYECLEKLGEGAYGKVFKVRHKTNGTEAALKTIIMRGDIEESSIMNEIGLMKMCADDENILSCYGTY